MGRDLRHDYAVCLYDQEDLGPFTDLDYMFYSLCVTQVPSSHRSGQAWCMTVNEVTTESIVEWIFRIHINRSSFGGNFDANVFSA